MPLSDQCTCLPLPEPFDERCPIHGLESYQGRVRDELAELEERLRKLVAFLATAKYVCLPDEERARLRRQSVVMNEYRQILTERIEAF